MSLPAPTCKLRKLERGKRHSELQAMAREDDRSRLLEYSYKQQTPEVAANPYGEPAFAAGESVLQWWSSWFKGCDQPPKTYAKKARPAWFSAEICSYEGVCKIFYAGSQVEGHVYNVY
jgi:hypothetical protein